MEASISASTEFLVTGHGAHVASPEWAREFHPHVVSGDRIGSLPALPPLTVVRIRRPAEFLAQTRFIDLLARKLQAGRPAGILILEFSAARRPTVEELASVIAAFPPYSRIELAIGPEHARGAVLEAAAKLLVSSRLAAAPEDALDRARRVVAATHDLRAASGRLSADPIARTFGIPVAEIAALTRRKRQTVDKTPDAESLQLALLPFERIARLRAVLTADDFRKWLRMPSDELGGAAPLDWVRDGRAAAVADLVADMLSGSPA